MSENIIATDATRTLILADVRAYKRDGKRYADYVVEAEVTADNLPEHVALFRDAYKTAYPKAESDEIRAYATKVRNGLRYWVGKAESTTTASTKYVTALGLKEDDRDAFVSKCLAEYDAAHADASTPTLVAVA